MEYILDRCERVYVPVFLKINEKRQTIGALALGYRSSAVFLGHCPRFSATLAFLGQFNSCFFIKYTGINALSGRMTSCIVPCRIPVIPDQSFLQRIQVRSAPEGNASDNPRRW